jgi:ferredoxin
MDVQDIEYFGTPIDQVKRPFKIPRQFFVPFKLPKFLTEYIAEKILCATISFDPQKCIRCGTCWTNCPTKAILPPKELKSPNLPQWESKKCITCYCCAETCLHEAVNFRVNIVKNVATSWLMPIFILFLALFIWILTLFF